MRQLSVIQRFEAVLYERFLSPQDRSTLNAEEDRLFYSIPRLVHHSDDTFRKKVTKLYEDLIPANSGVLDLCSSWTWHLFVVLNMVSCKFFH